MPTIHKPQLYCDAIDALVEVCRNGQGQIGPDRARKGLWNQNATSEFIPEQHRINVLLARLPREDRETIAEMLAEAFVGGAFGALSVLNDFKVAPFENGYEGAAYNDFVGRMSDWPWPKPEATLNGGCSPWPPKGRLAAVLRDVGLDVDVGKYAVRVSEGASWSVTFMEYDDDIGSPEIAVDAKSAGAMTLGIRRISAALAAADIRHRFEVHDSSKRLVVCVHHKWPNAA